PIRRPSCGTPPRRRGGRSHRDLVRGVRRNTPASAGRTTATRTDRRCRTEHPRVGGEDGGGHHRVVEDDGTPPRRRGGPGNVLSRTPVVRNTPASAGRTRRRRPHRTGLPEHPRVGGEDSCHPLNGPRICGTPPRRRGGPDADGGAGVGGRPPPRRRGGPLFTDERQLARRNTPTSAGRTPPSASPPQPPTEHPRVGGEDCTPQSSVTSNTGTPP